MNTVEFKGAKGALYKTEALYLRRKVFSEEQGIPEALDLDGKDDEAYHLIALIEEKIVATGRINFENRKGHISRIAVHPEHRKEGLGKKVVDQLISLAKSEDINFLYLYPHSYLEKFYMSFGFSTVPDSHEDLEGGHQIIRMEKRL
ncbi:MAG: hypothetical protein CMO01_29250 [Thalassobius sp.]|nr:hypothetical protein [Thalassovita sp.]